MTRTDALTLDRAADRASSWLFETAMPLWLAHGVDRERGGFYESLTLTDLRPATEFKRLRVLARQIYVFSVGALNGVEGAEEAVSNGLSFLLERARHPEGGFASRLDAAGVITDPTRDLYDLAFVLFALAHAYRVVGRDGLRQEAIALVVFVRSKMRHAAGGFVESLPPRSPRRQNPHMHLLEASLACLEYMSDSVFSTLVDEMTSLCQTAFMNTKRDRIFEYFVEDLSAPLRPGGVAVVEPGHHMEWAWLFEEVKRVRGVEVEGGAALAHFAHTFGLDNDTGLLRGELDENGDSTECAVRLWPHGEWLKAALRVRAVKETWVDAWRAVERFLDVPTPGLWREQWDPLSGEFVDAPAPASTLYHLTTAIVELRRASALSVQY